MTIQTQPTSASVLEYLETVPDLVMRTDSARLVTLMQASTGERPVMWGDSMVGFGQRRYRYASGREGDWFVVGFAPRAKAISLYLNVDFDKHAGTLARLGKHKLGKGCLYVRRLDDVDERALAELVAASVTAARAST
ncbi:MAG TPA: DUF1801 domain-containing protein [Aldersonia sp.]